MPAPEYCKSSRFFFDEQGVEAIAFFVGGIKHPHAVGADDAKPLGHRRVQQSGVPGIIDFRRDAGDQDEGFFHPVADISDKIRRHPGRGRIHRQVHRDRHLSEGRVKGIVDAIQPEMPAFRVDQIEILSAQIVDLVGDISPEAVFFGIGGHTDDGDAFGVEKTVEAVGIDGRDAFVLQAARVESGKAVHGHEAVVLSDDKRIDVQGGDDEFGPRLGHKGAVIGQKAQPAGGFGKIVEIFKVADGFEFMPDIER